MRKYIIRLNSIEKVKKFVGAIRDINCDIDLVSGRYVIDAKSIMGIFSMNLSKPITMLVQTDDKDVIQELEKAVVDYFVFT